MRYMDAKNHLEIEITTKECQIPENVRSEMQPDLDRLGRAVQELAGSQFWLTVVHHPRSEVFHAQAKLKVPGETIITGDRNEAIGLAIHRCLEKVIHRVEVYRENPDHGAVQQAVRNRQLNDIIAPVEPDAGTIGAAVERNDYPAFRKALLSQEEPLRMRVGRWIQRYPEIQQEIGRSFEIADIVEDVFLTAFERYPDRPTHLALHEWLASLIDGSVKDFGNDPDSRIAASAAQSLHGY